MPGELTPRQVVILSRVLPRLDLRRAVRHFDIIVYSSREKDAGLAQFCSEVPCQSSTCRLTAAARGNVYALSEI